jgi:hypothetical protein
MLTDKQINDIFDWCVSLLQHWAKELGMTYNAINVWLFCIILPLLVLSLFVALLLLCRQNNRLRRRINSFKNVTHAQVQ